MGHIKLTGTSHEAAYPDFLRQLAQTKRSQSMPGQPVVINMGVGNAEEKLKSLIGSGEVQELIDNYAEQYAELLLSQNAHLYRANSEVQIASIEKLLKQHYGSKAPWKLGSWVYYPWSGQLVHVLPQNDFEELRTIRNRDLITRDEQTKLLDFEAACFGMSVGSASAMALVLSGISRRIKLIDGAVISGSNLNRILTGVSSVGKGKAQIIGQNIYEMNPYSEVTEYNQVTSDNIEEIFTKPHRIKLAIDEIDDIEMKIRIRLEARRSRIPVLMATEIGDTIILDVERFDLEPKRSLFHDIIPGIDTVLNRQLDNRREWMKYAVRIIGPNNMTIKMQESLLKIGSTIVTHPQLGSTVMMTGGVLAFAAKSIALNHPLKSGRYVISLEKLLLSDHQTRNYKKRHRKHTKVISSAINSM